MGTPASVTPRPHTGVTSICTRLRASECSIKQTEELFKPCKVDLETPCRAFLIIKTSVEG